MLRGKTSLTPTNLRKSHFHSYRSLTKGGPAQDADYIFLKATYLRINTHAGPGGCSGQREGGPSPFCGSLGVCFGLLVLLFFEKFDSFLIFSLQYEQTSNFQAYPLLWGQPPTFECPSGACRQAQCSWVSYQVLRGAVQRAHRLGSSETSSIALRGSS